MLSSHESGDLIGPIIVCRMYREKHLCLNSRLLNPNTIKGATKTKFTAQQQQLIQWHQQSQQRAIQESYRKSSNKFRLLLAASWVFQLQLVKNTAALSHHQQCEFWNQLDCSHRGTCELFLFSIRIVVSKHHNFILIHSNSRQDTTRWNDNKAFRWAELIWWVSRWQYHSMVGLLEPNNVLTYLSFIVKPAWFTSL